MTFLPPSQGVVAIIGGGPAGAATAITLARAGVTDSVLIDAGPAFMGDRPQIGETIPPAATPVLNTLGLMEGASLPGHLMSGGSQSLWGDTETGFNDFLYDPAGRGYHLDRAAFDQSLRARATAEGATVSSGLRFRTIHQTPDGFSLGFSRADGGPHSLKCRFVVDATGAPAAVARKLGIARNELDGLISLCAIIPLGPEQSLGDQTLIEATEQGWWYAARLPGDRLILSFTSDRETILGQGLATLPGWRAAFATTRFMAAQIPAALLDGVHTLTQKAAPTAILSAVVGPNWLAVGDAASSYDPISSAGITKALMGGVSAGMAIADWVRRGDPSLIQPYQDGVFADFTAFVKLRYGLYEAEKRWPDAPFWSRRLARCA